MLSAPAGPSGRRTTDVLQDCRLGSSALCMSVALRAAHYADAVLSGAENSLLIRVDHVLRQAFVEVLASNEVFSAPMEETYKKLDIDPSSVTTLDAYLSEYYSQILKKLKEVGAQVRSVFIFVTSPPPPLKTARPCSADHTRAEAVHVTFHTAALMHGLLRHAAVLS